LFAALERPQSSDAPTSPSSSSPADSTASVDGASADVGLFYAQFFRAHFVELMEAHFPQSSMAALAMLSDAQAQATGRTTASSLPGSGLSADETKIALHGVVQQCIRSMEAEAARMYPPSAVNQAGCAFCILLVSGGVLYTYNSSFVTNLSSAGSEAVATNGVPSSTSSGHKSHSRGGSNPLAASTAPSFFQVMLCRAGRGIDLCSGGSGGGGGGSTDLANGLAGLSSSMSSDPRASTSLAGSFGFNNLLLSSPRNALGGAEVVQERALAPQMDEFVLMSFTPLTATSTKGAASSSAGPPLYPDAAALCQAVLSAGTPQATVDRLVEAQALAARGAGASGTKSPPLLLTLVYF